MQQENQEPKKKKSLLGALGTVITIILCAVLIPILVFNVTLIVKSLINKDQVPDFGGHRPFIVMSGSMEDTIMAGDLIVDKPVNTDDLKAGDIISFTDPAGNGVSVVTHRIVEVTEQNGEKAFRTRGDNNNTEDPDLVPASKVLGIYWFRLPGVGNVCMFMQTTAGLVVCVLVPLILFVLWEAVRRKQLDKKKQQDKDVLLAELEKLKAEKAEREAAQGAAEQKPAE